MLRNKSSEKASRLARALMLLICLTELCVDFSTWVALARLSDIGFITSRHAIVSLAQGLQFLKWTSSDISLTK